MTTIAALTWAYLDVHIYFIFQVTNLQPLANLNYQNFMVIQKKS